ncbi:uncharacterized protein N7496_009859 [Penicillium cataractarum]|uniref:C2 NT-type domain-containing protein n=1 Tax=Penicillium cataractarum TaxID=2100454 RepID=A0A9W9RQ98_9EURO|nr:uncharacterized protein N7496_009859 [Penicillium cataractarum]KAJ5364146.1 hypothetical protein N7496_009859 [Penicillium cataractarum]
MQAFVPKNRRPRFEVVLRINDINNVPLGNGTVWVRWRLPSSSATENQGHTEKAPLSDHRAYWNYEKALHVRLTIDRNSMLQECEINFEIIQEFHSSPSNEKNVLGKIKLNLAEYVDKVDEDEGVVRRYLMSDCKVNSTVKIGIAIRQVEGDRSFTTPPLKSATVFGGIARVVHSAEPGDSEELGHLPSINTKSREVADMQDMYRRTLAASWTSRARDLPADKLVEELFAGSSCWNNESHNNQYESYPDRHNDHLTAEAAAQQPRSGKQLSPSFERRSKSGSSNHSQGSGKTLDSHSTLVNPQKGGSIEQQLYDGAKGRGWKHRHAEHELSEFDVREDLRSWDITAKDEQ